MTLKPLEKFLSCYCTGKQKAVLHLDCIAMFIGELSVVFLCICIWLTVVFKQIWPQKKLHCNVHIKTTGGSVNLCRRTRDAIPVFHLLCLSNDIIMIVISHQPKIHKVWQQRFIHLVDVQVVAGLFYRLECMLELKQVPLKSNWPSHIKSNLCNGWFENP